MPWQSPLPEGISSAVRVFRPGYLVREAANVICDRGWRGQGVRIFRWPCDTLAVATVGSRGDAQLLEACSEFLLVTYARHGLFGAGELGNGPMLVDVMHDLNWARATG